VTPWCARSPASSAPFSRRAGRQAPKSARAARSGRSRAPGPRRS
jgi:hypothetical protein